MPMEGEAGGRDRWKERRVGGEEMSVGEGGGGGKWKVGKVRERCKGGAGR